MEERRWKLRGKREESKLKCVCCGVFSIHHAAVVLAHEPSVLHSYLHLRIHTPRILEDGCTITSTCYCWCCCCCCSRMLSLLDAILACMVLLCRLCASLPVTCVHTPCMPREASQPACIRRSDATHKLYSMLVSRSAAEDGVQVGEAGIVGSRRSSHPSGWLGHAV